MRQTTPVKKVIKQSPEILKLKKKRRNARLRFLILLSILSVTIIYGIVYVSRHQKFQINEVAVSGNQILDDSEIRDIVKNDILGNYLYFLPKKNIYLYPKEKIIRDLLQSFPRLQSVDVYRVNNNKISVFVSEVHVIALWCGKELVDISPQLQCYFTNNAGKIVSEAPYYSGDIYTRFFGGVSMENGANPIGKYILDKNKFDDLLTFAEKVKTLGLPVMNVNILDTGENQIILDLGKGNFAPIRFLAKDNYHTILGNLQAAITKPELAEKFKKNKTLLEYFDLRFKNKVYYKFSDAPAPVPSESKTNQ